MNENMSSRQEKAFEELAALGVPQEEVDKMRVYLMEQAEYANELYESAISDGVNFATTDDTGDVFVNTNWLDMIVKTLAEGMLLQVEPDPSTLRTAEVLKQTIIAANKFVGKPV